MDNTDIPFWEDDDVDMIDGELVDDPSNERWRCKDGSVLLMKNMAPSHLENAIRYCNRNLKAADKALAKSASEVVADLTDTEARESLKASLTLVERSEASLILLHKEKTRRTGKMEELKRIRAEAAKDVFE